MVRAAALVAGAIVLVAGIGAGRPAHAAAPERADPETTRLIADAVAEYDAGRFEEARALGQALRDSQRPLTDEQRCATESSLDVQRNAAVGVTVGPAAAAVGLGTAAAILWARHGDEPRAVARLGGTGATSTAAGSGTPPTGRLQSTLPRAPARS